MATAITLPGFNDLGRLVTPVFLLMDHFGAGHRHFCLYGFLQNDWSRQNQTKEIWVHMNVMPRSTGRMERVSGMLCRDSPSKIPRAA